MVEKLKQSVSRWPSYAWIVFLQVAFWIWNWLTLGLVIAAIWVILSNVLGGISWIEILITNQLLGWTVLSVLIWGYWHDRLRGEKPSVKNDLPFLTYCDIPVRKIIWKALGIFYRSREQRFTIEHFMPVFLKHRGVKIVLMRLDISLSDIKSKLIDTQDDMRSILVRAFEYALAEQTQVSWDHLLKSIIDNFLGFRDILAVKKISQTEALAVVDWVRKGLGCRPVRIHSGLLYDLFTPGRNLNKTWTAAPTPTLDRFSENLTALARIGLLSSAKVRKKEVEQAIRILSRGEENSLILVGETGVGKTSIVGDIALRMIKGDIPALEDYKLISLDIGAMIGAKIGFQKLFSRVVNEASRSGNTILFVGNLDQLGKARTQEGFDLSAILLGALEHKMQLVGTSDPLNYKKYIENNTNLVRLFSKINIEELDFDKAILVLEDLSSKIESRQKVFITLDAIKAAISLAQKYIHLGKIPDKALDLLDEAAVYASRRGKKIVTRNELEAVMSSKTNIPIGEISMEEKEKLVGLEEKIHSRLIGQRNAVKAVVESFKRARLGVASTGKRPIGSFLFLGPTGVGKTELAKSLAWSYFGDESRMIRLDMSEYQTKESIYRLLGAPATAGDIALAGGGFTEAVKKTPFAIVLLDEIEKAHPEILNVFLQVLDEGRLTDNLGNTVDFTHTIIIATSNAQARFIQKAVRSNVAYDDMRKQLVQLLIQESFRPEFINRFDGVIVFRPLTKSEVKQIAEIKINQLKEHLRKNKGIELEVSEGAIEKLAELGYDPAFGARPLERVIREKIESKIANTLLKTDVKKISFTEKDI